MSNFVFLKKNNENLFDIASEAEKLFRDEYFEQAVVQSRRFAESICRDLLQDNMLPDETFDSMINRLKDKSFGNVRMQEFTDDLYFLKKQGNNSVHSSVAVKDGKIALECLERAYEIAVFYSNVKYGYNKKLDKSVFSEEVLMTGKSSSSGNLKDKYSTELKKARKKPSNVKAKKLSATTGKIPKSDSGNNILSVIFGTITVLFLTFVALFHLYMRIKALF